MSHTDPLWPPVDDIAELAQDMRACSLEPDPLSDPVWLSRPALLRRAAAILAPQVPQATDRLLAVAASDLLLTAALSLHTGIPFACAVAAPGVPGPACISPGDRVVRLSLAPAQPPAPDATYTAVASITLSAVLGKPSDDLPHPQPMKEPR